MYAHAYICTHVHVYACVMRGYSLTDHTRPGSDAAADLDLSANAPGLLTRTHGWHGEFVSLYFAFHCRLVVFFRYTSMTKQRQRQLRLRLRQRQR